MEGLPAMLIAAVIVTLSFICILKLAVVITDKRKASDYRAYHHSVIRQLREDSRRARQARKAEE